MVVKRALLKSEITNIIKFLNQMDLTWDEDIVDSFYIEYNDEIIATGSRSKKVIKCLAVSPKWQQLNLISLIIDELIKSFNQDNIFHYFVVTQPKNNEIFKSLGFNEIIQTKLIVLMEKGIYSIVTILDNLKERIESNIKTQLKKLDVGSIVLNGNPVTLGHQNLIQKASENHDVLLVFLVEENESLFTFKERMSLLYLATNHLENVIILPSTEYLVSSATFPSYFLKNKTTLTEYQTIVDTLIFKNYFIPKFNIKKRYLGSEIKPYMVSYNDTILEILQDKVEIIERFEMNGVIISSSYVRELIKNNEIEKALTFIPKPCETLLKNMIRSKIDGK